MNISLNLRFFLTKNDIGGYKLHSENEIFHWSLNNSSNNNWHFLTIGYCMFLYGWSVLGLRFWLFIFCYIHKSLDNVNGAL